MEHSGSLLAGPATAQPKKAGPSKKGRKGNKQKQKTKVQGRGRGTPSSKLLAPAVHRHYFVTHQSSVTKWLVGGNCLGRRHTQQHYSHPPAGNYLRHYYGTPQPSVVEWLGPSKNYLALPLHSTIHKRSPLSQFTFLNSHY